MKEYLKIFWAFIKVGALTFGGGYAMLPILQREVVEHNHWASEEEIMDYYAKYRRNMAGMRLALEKLALVESYTDRVVATNNHELMRLHEAFDLLELCRAHLEACLQRKESGRGMYQLSDYPEKDPELAKGLVLTRKDGAFQFGWTE